MAQRISKINDTFNDQLSKADKYWSSANLQRFYRTFRKPMILPVGYERDVNSVERVQEIFKIRGFQFGNWVTTEDRFNYLAAMYICLFDLQRVLKFKNSNLGLDNQLAIAFGSRGVPKALAHYEPKNIVINISRYIRPDVLKDRLGIKNIPKEVLFVETGGIGAFAHEYGHFLDGVYGMYSEPVIGQPFLTGRSGSLTKDRLDNSKSHPMRKLVEDMYEQMFWKKSKAGKKVKTNFSERLEATKSDYLQNRQEIFARSFEQYIAYKLQAMKIKNEFMVQRKYSAKHYLTPAELKKVVPYFDKLMELMRKLS